MNKTKLRSLRYQLAQKMGISCYPYTQCWGNPSKYFLKKVIK